MAAHSLLFIPSLFSFSGLVLDHYVNECLSGTVKLKVEQKLEQIGKLQGVWLHTAHVLCMDAILSVGLEMGSHNPDCWPHVFRCMMIPQPRSVTEFTVPVRQKQQ